MATFRREVPCHRRSHWRAPVGRFAVLSLVLLLAGSVVVGPRRTFTHQPSRADDARLKVAKYAFEAYPSWAAAHPAQTCPPDLAALTEFMNSDDTNDAWGRPILMKCGGPIPVAARGIAVVSAGEDGRFGTCDDIQSWNPRHACEDGWPW